jgi:hypothetical protein
MAMEDETRIELKKLSGEHSHLLWKIAKTGDLSTLSPENKKLAEIMLEHEEYHNQFEIADLLSEHEYDVDNETNPFLHVTMHAIAETQDVARVQRYTFLVEDGVVSNLVESAIRFVISKSGVSTALLGISSRDQLEQAVKYVERGPLSVDTLRHIRATWSCPE